MEDATNRRTIHGVFLNVAGTATLITGESGIGKSECALALISQGHSLIADDAVIIERVGDVLFGDSPAAVSGLLHIRDLGIINIRELYGNGYISGRQKINLCMELRKEDDTGGIDRTAPVLQEFEILGVKIPKCVLIVEPARPLALLIETAARMTVIEAHLSRCDEMNLAVGETHGNRTTGARVASATIE